MTDTKKMTRIEKDDFARGRERLLEQIQKSKETIEHSQDLIKRIDEMLARGDHPNEPETDTT